MKLKFAVCNWSRKLKIGGLMYIEVAPDNPVYESRDGMLYNKGGELISRPNGR